MSSTSYRYVQQFVDREIQKLKEDSVSPALLREATAKGAITSKEAARIQRTVNEHIRRDVARRYRAQEKHLVVEQICKLEQENAVKAAAQLAQVENALGPLSLPDFEQVAVDGDILLEFAQIVDELPRREYLQTASKVDSNSEVLTKYEQVRDDLIDLRERWLYNADKLEYLRQLRRAVSASFEGLDRTRKGAGDGASHMYDSNEESGDEEEEADDLGESKLLDQEIDKFHDLVMEKTSDGKLH